jgi:hypothetical protein
MGKEDEKDLQKYAEEAAWERFKQEVMILKGYKFKKEQLQGHIDQIYETKRGTWT